ncbi:MAG: ATP-binding protein [Myxococcota bacterium]
MEPDRAKGEQPNPLGLAVGVGLAMVVIGASVTTGIAAGSLVPTPSFVGIGVLCFAASLAAALMGGDDEHTTGGVHGSIAFALVAALLGCGFLFGPLSAVVVAGVPVTGALTVQRLGRGWGAAVLAFGTVGAAALWVLGWAGIAPYAPAFLVPEPIQPVQAGLTASGMLLASGMVIALPLRKGRIVLGPETVTPVTPVRTGSMTQEHIRRVVGPDRYTPEDLAARADVAPDPSLPPSDVEATLELQKLESLGVLAGGIAHDFNNLLMSILGNASLALMEAGEQQGVLHPLREIEVAAKRARDLVGQLLAYAGKGTVSITPLDLNVLVREMGDLLATAGSRRATIDYAFCDATPLIVADATQVRQIVMNLITNAADSMVAKSDARIRVHTDIRHLDRERLDTTLLGVGCEPGAFVCLEVTDEGSGMSAETLMRIFDPFYTTKKTGRGLGLAAVLGIVRRYGGTMEVESTVGQGTTFRIFFPFAEAMDEDDDLPTEHTSTATGWAARESGVILVVDDDPVVLRVTCRMIQRLAFEVLEATDGEQAVAVFATQKERIIATVIDMTMPGMNGIETLDAIREIQPEARVILTSGYSEADIPSTEAVFLQKPYTMKQLTKALDRVLDEPVTRRTS